jgi:hypothetical protein
MSSKIAKRAIKSAARYVPEDLKSRDVGAEQAALDEYLERNKDALNASIEKADKEFSRDEYYTLDQAMADVRAQRERRVSRKS